MSGSVVSGRPMPMRTRTKSGGPKPAFSDFRPLWPARPPPRRVRISPNGRSSSSWTAMTWSSSTLQRAARRAGGAAGLVHVGLGQQDADPGAGGHRAAVGVQAGELLRAGQPPAGDERLGDREPHVVRGARVARAGVAEPDDQPVDGRGA